MYDTHHFVSRVTFLVKENSVVHIKWCHLACILTVTA